MSGANYSKNAGANNGREQDVIPEPLKRIREHTIRMLKRAGKTADTIYQSYAGREMGANRTGLFGGVTAVIGGGLATFATGGLAAPAALTAISLISGGSSIAGGCWSIKNGYDREKEFESLLERIWAIVREDEKEIHDMFKEILHRRSVRDESVLDPAQVFSEVHAAVAGGLDVADGTGDSSRLIKEMINRIPSVTNIISHGRFPILSGVVTVVCAIRSFIPANAKTLAKGTVKEVSEELAKVGMEATEEGAKTLSKQLAKNGAKAGAKTTAKTAGAVTMAFGAISTVWEGYNLYQNYYATKEESQLGKEFRELAYTLEISLKTGRIPF